MLNALRQTVSCLIDIIRRQGGGFVIGVGLALVFAIVMSKAWLHISVIFDLSFWSKGGTDVSRLDIVRNLSLVLGGGLGIGLALWRSKTAQDVDRSANRQAFLVEQGQITDRFSSAIKMLSGKNPIERIGGIHTLARLAESNIETYHIPVMQIFMQFIRDYQSVYCNVDRRETVVDSTFNIQKNNIGVTYSDLREIFSVIENRTDQQLRYEKEKKFRPYINEIEFININMNGIRFFELDIYGCVFIKCNLSGLSVENCSLSKIQFECCNLFGSSFYNSYIYDMNFLNTYSDVCNFRDVTMQKILILESSFNKAIFYDGNVNDINFEHSDFSDASVDNVRFLNGRIKSCVLPAGVCEDEAVYIRRVIVS